MKELGDSFEVVAAGILVRRDFFWPIENHTCRNWLGFCNISLHSLLLFLAASISRQKNNVKPSKEFRMGRADMASDLTVRTDDAHFAIVTFNHLRFFLSIFFWHSLLFSFLFLLVIKHRLFTQLRRTGKKNLMSR